MLQDVDRGAPTEIEFLNGAVGREGAAPRRPDARQRVAGARGARPRGRRRAAGRCPEEAATIAGGARLAARRSRASVGLVPTMGFLHEGHVSLVERARRENAHVAVSLFVNPTQFGPREDLAALPARPRARPRACCARPAATSLFVPTAAEMYPPGPPRLGGRRAPWPRPLEGERRPGHFRGVATVVLKLLNIVQPDRAYFGEKDAQQLAVIRRAGARPRRAGRDRRLPHRARAGRPRDEQPQQLPRRRTTAGPRPCSIARSPPRATRGSTASASREALRAAHDDGARAASRAPASTTSASRIRRPSRS